MLQIFIIICWLVVAALCVFVVAYGDQRPVSWQTIGLYLVVSAAGVAAAGCGGLSRLLPRPRHRLAAASAVLVVSFLPLAVSRAGRDIAISFVVGGCLIAAGAVLALPSAPVAGASPARVLRRTWVAAGLILLPWTAASLAALADSATGQPWDDAAISALITALGALFLPLYDLSAIAAVTSGALARQSAIIGWLGRHSSLRIVLVLLAAKASYIAVRLTAAPDLFGDRLLWNFWGRSPGSWLYASALASAICALAVRSDTHPLSDRGWRGAVLLIALVPAFPHLLDILGFVVFVTAFLISPAASPDLIERWLVPGGWDRLTTWGMLAVVVLLGLISAWRSRRDAWSASVVLLGLACAAMLPQTLNPLIAAGSALPGQVDTLITAAVIGVLVARAARASDQRLDRRSAGNRTLVRLLVVPFVVLHAVALVPAVLESHFLPALAVLAVVAATLTLPPAAADATRHARVLLMVLVTEIVGLITVALVELTNEPKQLEGLGGAATLSLLLMAVPLGGALCCRMSSMTIHRRDDDEQRSHPA